MPNHVQNILVIVGPNSHLKGMLDHIKGEREVIAFGKIFPIPEELQGTRSPAKIVTEAEYKKIQYDKNFSADPNPMFADKGAITKKMSKDWIERFGADNWYDWTCNHWGTKWGAYDSQLVVAELPDRDGYDMAEIRFQTAWSAGTQGVAALAEQYPTLEFYLKYADEDCGYNTGKIWWENGFMVNSEIPDYSMENYFECWGGEEDWTCVDGEWKWNEDED